MNLLHYNRCKYLVRLGHLSWPSSGRCFYEGNITKTTKPMYKYNVLSVKYVIHSMC